VPQGIAELAPLVTVLSCLISILSLGVAFAAFRRTSRLQDADYRPHMVISLDKAACCVDVYKDDDDEEDLKRQRGYEVLLGGKVTNAGPKPFRLIHGRVLLGPRHRDDPERALTVPFYRTLGPGDDCPFHMSLQWGTIWDIAQHFHRTVIECQMAIEVEGADGVRRQVTRFLGTSMECESNEWTFIGPEYFMEIVSDLEQARLRSRLKPAPASRI
jgi:hypothetical protein